MASPLLLITAFIVKHCICDFFLQTPYQYRNKGIYMHPGGMLHAGLHGLGSLAAFLVCGALGGVAIIAVLVEVVVHYHIDWGKVNLVKRYGMLPEHKTYWWVFGLDQMLHYLTNVAMIWAIL